MRIVVWSILGLLLTGSGHGWAEDRRPLVEPAFPPTCSALAAPLAIDADGPVAGDTAAEEDRESGFETNQIQRALDKCRAGQAVELTLGLAGHSGFLIDPITFPQGVSLIVDGGVTVYATRNPRKFQDPAHPKIVCGTVGEDYPVDGGCLSLFSLSSESGIYGYGVLDGQGQRGLIRDGRFVTDAWWDLLAKKKKGCGSLATVGKAGCEQASPPMISAGFLDKGETGKDLTLLKFTIRNPPFHTVRLAGTGITVWGVKVQAPWNVPNSDGFDVQGTNILFLDDTVANGDQDIAIVSGTKRLTSHMLIDRLTAYGKGGVALLDAGEGITDVLVADMAMTADVPSFVTERRDSEAEPKVFINGVDVRSAPLRGTTRHLASYGQALPTATHDLEALQINWNTNSTRALQTPGPFFSDITFDHVCVQDVTSPIRLEPVVPYSEKQKPSNMPTVKGVTFRDVHVLTPTQQFPDMTVGVVTRGGSGTYSAIFYGNPGLDFYVHFVLDNVVFDDLASGKTALSTLYAVGNMLGTRNNIYPAALNRLADRSPPYAGWTIGSNSYEQRTAVPDPGLAVPCPSARWPFLTGELYVSRTSRAPGGEANLRDVAVPAGSTVALKAVLQPAMSQTTWFRRDSYGAEPGLLAVGSPALTNPVLFYEGDILVGVGRLGSNGTLATALVRDIAPGTHFYTARYPGDTYYRPFAFGLIRLCAK